jgi:hypothetical protein
MKKELDKVIRDFTVYSGVRFKRSKTISASSLSSDLLPLYLKYMNGYDEQEKLEKSNTGSLIHASLELAFSSEKNYEVEVYSEIELHNKWRLTGTIDIVNAKEGFILDWKNVIKERIVDEIKKDGKYSNYSLQLGAYKALMEKKYNKPFKSFIYGFDNDQSYFKKDAPDNHTYLLEIETLNSDEILELALEKTNELQGYIDDERMPEQCSNLMWSRKYGKKAVPIGCKRYCNVSSGCPHYKSSSYMENQRQLNKLLGL